MGPGILKRLSTGAVPFFILLPLLLLSLHWMSASIQNTTRLGDFYLGLLTINGIGLIALLGLIIANLYRLISRYRAGAAGSQLTLRMVGMFIVLALAPTSVVYYYSMEFLHRGIDSWFDVQIDDAMEDALELSRSSLDVQMRERLKLTNTLLDDLVGNNNSDTAALTLKLSEQRAQSGAQELTLVGKSGEILASANASTTVVVPDRPDDDILLQVRQGDDFVGLAPIRDEGLYIRVVITNATAKPTVLQALFNIPERLSNLAVAVELAYQRYTELSYLRDALKYSFSLTLSLALLFSLLSAIWLAFYVADRITAPIRDLVEGTKTVAAGDYDRRLPLGRNDELGFLVRSFNDMTSRLARARDEARESQRQVEAQRAYLETVLSSLSSGVITFDDALSLRTANREAARILNIDLHQMVGLSLAEITQKNPSLRGFTEAFGIYLEEGQGEWREEVQVYGADGRQILICRSAPLSLGDRIGGHVVIFDDITTLIRAQRDAAWGEVARRMAHEIKNPLTPIQLSAERLRHKFLGKMDEKDSRVLERSTTTIVQQVESMKEMVNAFSDYARPPRMKAEPVDITRVISQVLDLYRNNQQGVTLAKDLAQETPTIQADAGRLRQVLHNLIKNALEAMEQIPQAQLTISCWPTVVNRHPSVEIRIRDNGPGFDEESRDKIFEPYMTTKTKGTGLGLAIVKKIVEEHNGMIRAENNSQGGGCIILQLPVTSSRRDEELPESNKDARRSMA